MEVAGSEYGSMASEVPANPSTSGTLVKGPPLGHRAVSWLVVAAAVTASLSGLMMGYEMGLTSGVLLQLRGLLSLSCWQQELLVSSYVLGAFLMCLAGGPVVDRYGRRCSLLVSNGLVVGGSVVLVVFTSFAALTAGRLIVGMGTALSGTAACLYIAEISTRERRGLLVTLYELMVVVGVLLGFSCSYAFAAVAHGWTYTFGLVIPVALLQFTALLLFPRSPRFLVTKGEAEQARAVLARLRGGASEQVEAELHEIQAGLKEEAQHSFSELFSTKANLRSRLLTGVALVFLQQVTGQPNILSYASPLLRSVGFRSDAAATLACTGFGVVKVAGTIPAVLLVDRVGPKSFLCLGAVAMGLSLVTLGVTTLKSHTHLSSLCTSSPDFNRTHAGVPHAAWDPNATAAGLAQVWSAGQSRDVAAQRTKGDGGVWISAAGQPSADEKVSSSLKWMSLISLLVFVAAFSVSLGPMVYVVLSEIFPMGVRGKAVSVVSAVNWASNLLISMTFLTITEEFGVPTVMFIYAAMSFVLLVFVILCVPETKGRTLEQISKELAMKQSFRGKFCKPVRPNESLINNLSDPMDGPPK